MAKILGAAGTFLSEINKRETIAAIEANNNRQVFSPKTNRKVLADSI